MNIYEKEKRKLLFPFLFPAVILYSIFFVYPSIQAFYYSGFDWQGFTKDKEFIGLENFIELFQDDYFYRTLTNTFLILVICGVIIFFLAFLFSSIMNSGIKARVLYRNLIFLPNIITPVAIAIMWGFLLDLRFGLINSFFKNIGLEFLAQPWMGNKLIFYSLMAMIIWALTGFYMMILYSAMIKIPRFYFESAKLDGANQITLFFKITLPMIWDVFVIAVVYWVIFALKAFEIIYSFTGQALNQKIWTVAVYTYILGFSGVSPIYRLGYATAVAVVLFLFILIFVLIFRIATNREAIEY